MGLNGRVNDYTVEKKRGLYFRSVFQTADTIAQFERVLSQRHIVSQKLRDMSKREIKL